MSDVIFINPCIHSYFKMNLNSFQIGLTENDNCVKPIKIAFLYDYSLSKIERTITFFFSAFPPHLRLAQRASFLFKTYVLVSLNNSKIKENTQKYSK